MNSIWRFREWVWPILEPHSQERLAELQAEDDAKKAMIAALPLKKQAATALDEARRLSDMEFERRRSADQKATTYLTFVAAIVPLILTFASALWDK